MRIGVRIVLVSVALGLVLGMAGCKGVTPPSIREEEPSAQSAAPEAEPQPASEAGTASAAATKPAEPAKPTSGQYASSLTSAGVAVGAELQHTDQWLLGGKLWAMTIDGKPDNVTDKPKIQLVAVNANGAQSLIGEVPADSAKGVATIQGGLTVAVPPGTVRLLISTTLRAEGANAGPVLAVALDDVPVVKAITVGQ